MSLSTLDRRIADGQLAVGRVQQGQVQRIIVLWTALHHSISIWAVVWAYRSATIQICFIGILALMSAGSWPYTSNKAFSNAWESHRRMLK